MDAGASLSDSIHCRTNKNNCSKDAKRDIKADLIFFLFYPLNGKFKLFSIKRNGMKVTRALSSSLNFQPGNVILTMTLLNKHLF